MSSTEGGGDSGLPAPSGAGSGTSAEAVAATASLAGSHGVLLPFNGDQDEWIKYAERLENYFIDNDVTDKTK